MKARTVALTGSIAGGFLASVCCIVPVAFALLGISGAALAHRFEPLRPYLLVLTYGLLAAAFYLTYRPRPAACDPGEACGTRGVGRASKVALWIAAFVVALATTFPLYSVYLF